MANLNLLPWREDRRQRRQKEYLLVLGVVSLICAGMVWGMQQWVDQKTQAQQQRNQFLQQQIGLVKKQISEIKDLQKRREDVQARMTIIQELQLSRSEAVRLMDTLARIVPVGVYLVNLEKRDNNIFINAVAETNSQISTMMRNIGKYDYFGSPQLSDIAQTKNSSGLSFRISFSSQEVVMTKESAS